MVVLAAGSAIWPSIRASLSFDSLARGRVIETLRWTGKPASSLSLSCQDSRSRRTNSLDWYVLPLRQNFLPLLLVFDFSVWCCSCQLVSMRFEIGNLCGGKNQT